MLAPNESSNALGHFAENGLPYFERFRSSRAPGVVAVVGRPDDLVEREMFAAED
jgi:hypothetical protein